MKPYLLLGLLFFYFLCDAQDPVFQVLRKKDHSSFEGIITSIYRDTEGFLWFGSSQGLLRYDGNSYMRFDYQQKDTSTLSHSDIEYIFEDSKKRLWFGSKYGLNLYIKHAQTFKRFYPYSNPKENINRNRIKAICQQNDSILWIASYGGGVCKFNINTGTFKQFTKTGQAGSLPSNIINYVYIDRKGRLWVGSESGGLSQMNTTTGFCKNYLPDPSKKNSLSDATVSSIIDDAQGKLWVGTWRGGLNCFNPDTEAFESFIDLLPSKTIRSIVRGRDNQIWIATYKGVASLNTLTREHQLYLHDPLEPKSLLYDVNWSIYFDQENILWLGTMGKGVCYANFSNKPFRVPHKWDVQFRNSFINAFQLDGSTLWMGTEDAGVLCYNLKTNKIIPSSFNTRITGQVVYGISKDKQNNIWVGTNAGLYCVSNGKLIATLPFTSYIKGFSIYSVVQDNAGNYLAGGWNTGLIEFSGRDAKTVNVYKAGDRSKLPADIIWKIFADNQKRIWILTSAGVGQWNQQTKTFNLLLKDPNMFAMNQDANGTIWCGTSFGEILYFDPAIKQFKTFFKFTDEPFRIAAIHFSKENLWIATQSGLFRLNKKTKLFRRYTVADGLPSNFFTWAHETLPNGEIIIGTANGPVIINPGDKEKYIFRPNLVITHMDVFDKKKSFKDNRIELAYHENKVSIGFTALSLATTGIITYHYKLSGIDNEEVVTTENKAVYTNLDPGTYTFTVSYQTADGLAAPTPAQLIIIIATPWWQTWWFRALLITCLAGIIISIYYNRVRSIRRRNKELEEEVKKRTIEISQANAVLNSQNELLQERKTELEKLNETKTKLFSIIGHDLKNPISVIIQFSDLMNASYEKYDVAKRREFIAAINNSSRNAFNLLMNLLDWARTQQDRVHVDIQPVQLQAAVNDVILFFKEQLEAKQLSVESDIASTSYVLADKHILHTCLRNILSNAIKYSRSGATISIQADANEQACSIQIKDMGIGMNSTTLHSIFTIQKQSVTGTASERGTGLGLLIVKEFIQLIHGTLDIHSIENKGTTVTLSLPTTTETPAPPEQSIEATETITPVAIGNDIDNENIRFLQNKRILIIDDDADLRKSLAAILDEYADVIQAEDGASGLQLISESNPDLIICDVEMPGIKGLEVCTRVKNDIVNSHTPFILLTALDSDMDTIKGLQAGADEYITKPFNRAVLLLKINSVFRQRQLIQTKLLIEETAKVDVAAVSSVDDKLLNKIVAIIHEHIADGAFSVEQLSEMVHMHRTHLNRKMNALVNMPASDFIRIIRLKKAAELLKTGKLSIAEVAYDTGFNDAKYFSKCFKEFFGKSPKEYAGG